MPAMSPTMTEGGIAGWKKNEGESFEAGDVILEVVSKLAWCGAGEQAWEEGVTVDGDCAAGNLSQQMEAMESMLHSRRRLCGHMCPLIHCIMSPDTECPQCCTVASGVLTSRRRPTRRPSTSRRRTTA